ncbi:endonuclease/exonuclease/phosphatase family protein [Corallincola platygyrae]|uniref:Endonuclease/exonuclease/phosphatase family protein n=1 Tax=Corallincola platygyrae TaxID=1193278 RepID=A0ABW4XUD0_9GAMM
MSAIQGMISGLILWLLFALFDVNVPLNLQVWHNQSAPLAVADCREQISPPLRPLLNSHSPAQKAPDALPKQINLLVWNTYKFQNTGWQQELADAAKHADMLLLQEVAAHQQWHQWYSQAQAVYPSLTTPLLVRAFEKGDAPAGVWLSSSVPAQRLCASRFEEPWIGVPKSLLAAEYAWQGQTLLIVNLHGVNFSWALDEFQAQIQVAADLADAHDGPVVVAGDFNTWRQARVDSVSETLRKVGLQQIRPSPDLRTRINALAIDQVWVKGLDVVNAHSAVSETSDHNQITISIVPLTNTL